MFLKCVSIADWLKHLEITPPRQEREEAAQAPPRRGRLEVSSARSNKLLFQATTIEPRDCRRLASIADSRPVKIQLLQHAMFAVKSDRQLAARANG